MHEFSLAKNIIEIVEEAIQKNNATKVTRVELEIGKLSGVEVAALDTALDCLKQGSVIHGAEIIMNTVDATAICNSCGSQFLPEDLYTPCPKCNSFSSKIILGKEMIVKSIIAE